MDVDKLQSQKVDDRALLWLDDGKLDRAGFSLSAQGALMPFIEKLRDGEPKTIVINQAGAEGVDLVEKTFSTQQELKDFLSATGSMGLRNGGIKVVHLLKELKAGGTYTVEFARVGFKSTRNR